MIHSKPCIVIFLYFTVDFNNNFFYNLYPYLDLLKIKKKKFILTLNLRFFLLIWLQNFTLGFNSLYQFTIGDFLFRHFSFNAFLFLYIRRLACDVRGPLIASYPNSIDPITFKNKMVYGYQCVDLTRTHWCTYW